MTDITTRLAELKALAEAQADAYATMLDIDQGVGGLGVRHPEKFEAMMRWADSTENEHADTVLALIAALEGVLDLAENAVLGTEPSPQMVTTGQELEALIQENPRAVLELRDGSVCRAERFRSLGEGFWEDELPAKVLSPAPRHGGDAHVTRCPACGDWRYDARCMTCGREEVSHIDAIKAEAWDEGHRTGMYDGVTAAKIAQTGDLSALPGPTRNPYRADRIEKGDDQ